MTAHEKEEIAVLQVQVSALRTQLENNTKVTNDIKATLDNLTGGKQALMWITGVFVALAAVVAAFFEAFHKAK